MITVSRIMSIMTWPAPRSTRQKSSWHILQVSTVRSWFFLAGVRLFKAAQPAWFTQAITQAITPVKILAAQVSTRGSQVIQIFQLKSQTRNHQLHDGQINPFVIVPFIDGTMPDGAPVSSESLSPCLISYSLFSRTIFRHLLASQQSEIYRVPIPPRMLSVMG